MSKKGLNINLEKMIQEASIEMAQFPIKFSDEFVCNLGDIKEVQEKLKEEE